MVLTRKIIVGSFRITKLQEWPWNYGNSLQSFPWTRHGLEAKYRRSYACNRVLFFWLSFPGAAENWIPKRRAGKCHQMAPPAPLNLNCFSSSPQRSCLILGFLWSSQPCAPITGARAQSPRKVFAATKESYFQATSLAAVCSSEFINEVSWWSWCIVLSPFHQSCGILWSVGFYHG